MRIKILRFRGQGMNYLYEDVLPTEGNGVLKVTKWSQIHRDRQLKVIYQRVIIKKS